MQFDIHPNQISDWKKQMQANASQVIGGGPKNNKPDVKAMHAKIGELTHENVFSEKALIKATCSGARATKSTVVTRGR